MDTTRQAARQARGRIAGVAGSVVLTRQGKGFLVAAVLLLLAAHVFAVATLTAVACLLAGLVVAAAVFVVVGQSRVRIERSFDPEVVEPGEATTARLHVSNLTPWPTLESRWADRLPPGISGESAGSLPSLGGARSAEPSARLTYELRGVRRGRHPIGPLEIQATDPFGLAVRRHRFGEARDVVVLPRRVPLSGLRVIGTSDDGATRPAPQHVGVGEDDVIARPYSSGDAMKRLHWKATAHRGELMVRQEEQQINPQACVLLDLDARGLGTALDRQGAWEYSPAFEWAVVATASVVDHLARAGFVVVLAAPGGGVERRVADGVDTVRDALVDLATIEPTEMPADVVALAPSVGRFTVAILGRLDAERAAAWSRRSGGSGLALVAAGTPGDCVDVLERRGWRCVTYRPSDDLDLVWQRFDTPDRQVADRHAAH